MMNIADDTTLMENIAGRVSDYDPSINEERISLSQPPNGHLPEIEEMVVTKRLDNDRTIVHMQRRVAMKNLIVMSFSYFLFFLGFWALSNLQSTMNSSMGLGVQSQAVIYALSMVSSLFLPELVVKTIGCKKTLVYTLLISCVYLAANMRLTWEFIIPGSVLYGLASGPFSTAQSVYVEELAVRYARESPPGETLEHVMANFFGIYMIFTEATQIFGNAASYIVFHWGSAATANVSSNVCGMSYHRANNNSNPNLEPPSDEKRYTLVGFYLLCGLLAVIVMGLGIDPLHNDVVDMSGGQRCRSVWDRVWAAVKLHRDPRQFLMIPLTVFVGLEGAVYANDFTEAYIACSWGVQHVGFVSICFGVCGALMALLAGPLVKCASQVSVITFAAVINVGVCVTLFLWRPSPDEVAVYFIIAGVWGMADAIWWSQVTALYGLMFPNDREAAFSNFYFWSFLGYFLCYSYANYVTVVVKINILLCMLISGMAGYYLCLLRIRCSASSREYAMLGHDD